MRDGDHAQGRDNPNSRLAHGLSTYFFWELFENDLGFVLARIIGLTVNPYTLHLVRAKVAHGGLRFHQRKANPMKTTIKNVPVYDRQTKASISIDVDVEVDVYRLAAKLAPPAYENKSGKASISDNDVVVVVVRRCPAQRKRALIASSRPRKVARRPKRLTASSAVNRGTMGGSETCSKPSAARRRCSG